MYDEKISFGEARTEIIARIKQNGSIRKTEALNICQNGTQLEGIIDVIPGLMKTVDDKNRAVFFIAEKKAPKTPYKHIRGRPLLRGHVTVGA